MAAKPSLFLSNPLFANLPQDTLDQLQQTAIQKTYQTGEIFVQQETVWPYLFLVLKGEIHAIKESLEGRAFIGTTLREGDIFWGLAFFIENASMPVLLQADRDSQTLLWSRETLNPILNQYGIMSMHLARLAIRRMQQASGIVEELAFHPVMSRLAGLLLETFGDADDKFKTRELTLDDMAARIGTTREMVCRHLYKFADMGAIEISRTELRIADRDFLENQAKKH